MRILELLLCAACITDLASAMDVAYMDQWCGETYVISNSPTLRIKLTASSIYRLNMNCTFNVAGDYISEDRLMITFQDLSTESVCAADYLAIFDGQNKMNSKIGNDNFCGHRTPNEVFTSTGSSLTFYFKSDGSVQHSGFDIILTHYKTGLCSAYEISCDNGRCVDAGLVCNGYNPCGDHSDCKSTTLPTPWNLMTWTIPTWNFPRWTLTYDNFTLATVRPFYTGDTGAGVSTTWRYTWGVVCGTVGIILIVIIIVIVVVVRRRRTNMYQRSVPPVTVETVSTRPVIPLTSTGYNQPVPQQFQIPTANVQAIVAPLPPPYEYSQSMPQQSRQIPTAPGSYADQNMASYPPPPPYSAK